MKHFLHIAIIALSAVSSICAQPTCAVLPFNAGPGFTETQAARASANFRSELDKTGKFNILPEKTTKDKIDQNLGHKPASITPYYLIAGNILKVDYVITGIVKVSDGTLWLNTDLCDINNKKIKKRVKVYYKGDVDTFLNMAPTSNLKQLLSLDKQSEQPFDSAKAPYPNTRQSAQTKSAAPATTKRENWNYHGALETVRGYAHDNIQAGFRISYYKLMDTEKESFLGSINKLQEDQNFMPRLFARVKIMEPFWITLGYNQIKAKTWTDVEPDAALEGYTDGTIELSGPHILLHFHSKRQNDLQWFSEIGFGLYGASFIHDPAWRDARGDINSHIMVFEDTVGVIINGGCDLFLSENISMSAYAGYTRVTSDMTYYLYGNERDSRTFPLSNLALGLGLQYHF